MCRFFFNDTATAEISALSLHDALPISPPGAFASLVGTGIVVRRNHAFHNRLVDLLNDAAAAATFEHDRCGTSSPDGLCDRGRDRKSTRLNSSHRCISYAVFCLKKKKST